MIVGRRSRPGEECAVRISSRRGVAFELCDEEVDVEDAVLLRESGATPLKSLDTLPASGIRGWTVCISSEFEYHMSTTYCGCCMYCIAGVGVVLYLE